MEEKNAAQKLSIFGELSSLSKQGKNNHLSTARLRTIVMNKCLESGQLTKKFNNNMQYDCVEFLQSLLEHFWKEPSIPSSLGEDIFGGLFQECYECECGNIEKQPIKILPDILSLPIQGKTVQTCLDAYLASEEIVRRCSNCKSMKSSRSSEILVPPSTLILHLKRFFYDESKERVTKLHVPVYCPLNLLINNSVMYQFNAVINHMGESSSAGHYNILFHGKEENNFILVDDSDIQYNADIISPSQKEIY